MKKNEYLEILFLVLPSYPVTLSSIRGWVLLHRERLYWERTSLPLISKLGPWDPYQRHSSKDQGFYLQMPAFLNKNKKDTGVSWRTQSKSLHTHTHTRCTHACIGVHTHEHTVFPPLQEERTSCFASKTQFLFFFQATSFFFVLSFYFNTS